MSSPSGAHEAPRPHAEVELGFRWSAGGVEGLDAIGQTRRAQQSSQFPLPSITTHTNRELFPGTTCPSRARWFATTGGADVLVLHGVVKKGVAESTS